MVASLDARKDDAIRSMPSVWVKKEWLTREGFLEWGYKALGTLERFYEERNNRMFNNLLWYTGEYDPNQEYKLIIPGKTQQRLNTPYLVDTSFNHLYNLTEERVSTLAAIKPTFDCMPWNRDSQDRVSARLMKKMLDSVSKLNKVNLLFDNVERWAAVLGEIPVFTEYDKSIGDIGEDKKPQGDVSIRIKEPWNVLYETKSDFTKVRYLFEIEEVINVEEARVKFKDDTLTPDGLTTVWSYSTDSEYEKNKDDLVVYRFIHEPCEELPFGLYVRFVGKTVIEWEDKKYKYSHGKLPLSRHTDIDIIGRINPISFYNFLIPAQHQLNKMTSLLRRNIFLTCHPKWFMTKGACDIKSLGNSATIVETNPNFQYPKMEVFQSVPNEAFNFRGMIKDELTQLAGIQRSSLGETPANARAASIYKFLQDEQTQRHGTQISKRNDLVVSIFSMAAVVVQDYYPTNAERMIRVVGRDNQYEVKKLSEVKISSNVSVEIQNSTGVSETKAGRMEEVAFCFEKLPGVMTTQQAADVLEMQSPQKFYDVTTAALKMAENENQMFMDGEPVPEPIDAEDHISHLNTHRIFAQGETFKNMPRRFQENWKEHYIVHEMFAMNMAAKSQAFAQAMSQVPQFPIFWQPEAQTLPDGGGAGGPPPMNGQRPEGPGRPPQPQTPQEMAAALAEGSPGNPAAGPTEGNPSVPPGAQAPAAQGRAAPLAGNPVARPLTRKG